MAYELNFSDYITDRTRDFTGREWVFAEIDGWLAKADAPRFFIITGEPGIGKSAIAARVTQVYDLAAYHFCIARRAETIDPLQYVQAISQQLSRLEGFSRGILEQGEIHLRTEQHVQQASDSHIVGVQIERLVVQAPSAAAAFAQTISAPLQALYAEGFDGQLLLLVDALDEAVQHSGLESIVDLLANAEGLPSNVRFLLTSRPEGTALRHFRERGIPYLSLDAGQEENLADAGQYVSQQVAASVQLQSRLAELEMEAEAFIERVVAASQGNFLYLVWLLRAVADGHQSLDALHDLPQGLDGVYREFLRTRTVGRDIRGPWRERYRPLLGVLAAAQAPLTAAQLARFTKLPKQDLRDALLDVEQFLDPIGARQDQYQLYHQSVADFLGDEERAEEFWIDLAAAHSQIAAACQEEEVQSDPYRLRYLPIHLLEAGRPSELHQLLLQFSWLQAKLQATNPAALVADYKLLPDDEDLHLVQDALQLAAHVLVRDKAQLPGQLLGRLLGRSKGRLQGLLAQAKELAAKPWLRPLIPSLALPGGPLLRTLEYHLDDKHGDANPVVTISITHDGRRLVCGYYDSTVVVLDLYTGECLHTHRNIGGGGWWVSDVTPDDTRLVSGGHGGRVSIWDLKSGTLYEEFDTGHRVDAIKVLSNENLVVFGGDRNMFAFWQIRRGPSHTLALPTDIQYIKTMSISSNGELVLFAGENTPIYVFDLGNGTLRKTISKRGSTVAIAITGDGRLAFVAGALGVLQSFDVKMGESRGILKSPAEEITAIAVTDDGRIAVSASRDGTFHVWDLASEAPADLFEEHIYNIDTLAVIADQVTGISASFDAIKAWDVKTGTLRWTYERPHSGRMEVTRVAIGRQSHFLVSASGGRVQVLNTTSGELVEDIQQKIDAQAVSSNGLFGALALPDGLVQIWDLDSGVLMGSLGENQRGIRALAIDANGRLVATGTHNGDLKVWDVDKSDLCRNLRERPSHRPLSRLVDQPFEVSISDDRKYLVSAFGYELLVWNLDHDGPPTRLKGHKGWVRRVVLAESEGQIAICISDDRKVWVWDLVSGSLRYILEGHQDVVYAAIVMTDSRFVISASKDRTLRVWSLQTGVEITRFYNDTGFTAVITSNGPIVFAGDMLGRVHILRLEGI